jgi:hypothetical protein
VSERNRIIYEGSTEVVSSTVSAEVSLSAQVVSFSFDGGTTWKTAAWAGTAGKVREAELTVSDANLPTYPFGPLRMLVKVDNTIKPALGRLIEGREIPVV